MPSGQGLQVLCYHEKEEKKRGKKHPLHHYFYKMSPDKRSERQGFLPEGGTWLRAFCGAKKVTLSRRRDGPGDTGDKSSTAQLQPQAGQGTPPRGQGDRQPGQGSGRGTESFLCKCKIVWSRERGPGLGQIYPLAADTRSTRICI